MNRKRSEYDEQARIIAMGADREDKLRRQLAELLRIAERLAAMTEWDAPIDIVESWKRKNGFQ